MKTLILIITMTFFFAIGIFAQVTASPSSINAYSQGATSAYLTFSNVVNLRPSESVWCGELVPAAPDIGQKCDPTTVFGVLPARYDQSRLNGSTYTDIMSITPSIARRAYTDAVNGNDSRFFYVRHFVGTNGNDDEFVPITIRLSGNGAGVPFSLTAVKLNWKDGEKIVPFVKSEDSLPKITAEIRYTGTGRIQGRWEIVKPGEALPERRDLLSESTLPRNERGTQKRYTLLSRFNIDLPPGGKFTLHGPENWRIDKSIEGMYVLLFRIESGNAMNSTSETGLGNIRTGAVAGFPMPTMRYYVGNSGDVDQIQADAENTDFSNPNFPTILRWNEVPGSKYYRLEIADEGKIMFSAIVLYPTREYQIPSFIQELTNSKTLTWKAVAIASNGSILSQSSPIELK